MLLQEDIAADVATGKVKLQLPTPGSSGRPLLIIKARLHRPGASPQQIASFIYFCLEAASHLCWHPHNSDGKLSALFDLSGGRGGGWEGTLRCLQCSGGTHAARLPESATRARVCSAVADLQLKNLDATALRSSFSILEQVGAALQGAAHDVLAWRVADLAGPA